ncbi:MAG: pectate lyase [Chloroflexi bacterium]|nr:pectate lyase [Chloroflexota bacterium]
MFRSLLLCLLVLVIVLTACASPTPTVTPVPTQAPTAVPTVAPTPTSVPPTATKAPPTATPVPPTATSVPPTATAVPKRDLGKETLAPNDGWAAEGKGTTGGSAAKSENVYTVRNRKELIAALNDGKYPAASTTPSNTAKIIYVDGTIDLNVDDSNKALTCIDYQKEGYTIQAYNAAFDPAVWGKKVVSGTLETARVASQKTQDERVRVRVGSNTTIVGVDAKATIKGGWFDIRGTATAPLNNIIVRNLTFQDTYDCFPQWDPTDGTDGNWNSQYDMISLRYVDHVWIDHNTFQDVETEDSKAPTYFGRHFEMHDGTVDITNAADLVTVSWNKFANHDKTMLIGSSDSGSTAAGDKGKLRVTLHHNFFDNLGQRTPRVRFGQVHVYNNYYRVINNPKYGYSFGVGIESQIYAENNYFKTDDKVALDKVIGNYKGTMLYIASTRVNDQDVDLLALHNAANQTKIADKVAWKPTLVIKVDPIATVISTVESGAGPIR